MSQLKIEEMNKFKAPFGYRNSAVELLYLSRQQFFKPVVDSLPAKFFNNYLNLTVVILIFCLAPWEEKKPAESLYLQWFCRKHI